MKDEFKKKNIKLSTSLNWNAKPFIWRNKGDTQLLHRLSRRKLKEESHEIMKNNKENI